MKVAQIKGILRSSAFVLVATTVSVISGAWASPALAQPPLKLVVDAREAARNIFHATLTLPVKPGPLTLVYPKWIPGEHGPTGPINNIGGLRIQSGGAELSWRRDFVDLYAFGVDVPANTSTLTVSLDLLLGAGGAFSSGGSSTSKLAIINWNQLLLYPKGGKPHDLPIAASIILPPGWQFGTALPVAAQHGDRVDFAPVSLETLVDSPLATGMYFRKVALLQTADFSNEIDLVADSRRALDADPKTVGHFRNLVAEADALFGARHWRHYHFLFTLSDDVEHFGLEHHESSDDRLDEKSLIDPDLRELSAGLLPHEFVHSWNGKYRRPADLATPDFQLPEQTDLLWVYEGLTTYLGDILTYRSGLREAKDFPDDIAETAAALDVEPGRQTRSLLDTAVAAPYLYLAPREWESLRRGVDFYPESELIWMEADTIIRDQTGGKRSLDDFCRLFFGGINTQPTVIPYTRDDVMAALQSIAAYDWRGFFAARVDAINRRAPMGGIERAGWRLVYNEKPPKLLKLQEGRRKTVDLRYSLGVVIGADATVIDVYQGSPAARAGLGPRMKLVAVNSRRYDPDDLHAAIKAAKTAAAPIDLLVDDLGYFKTLAIAYHGGERYPHLQRVAGRPDLLREIVASKRGRSSGRRTIPVERARR